jgi:hypothetical protein
MARRLVSAVTTLGLGVLLVCLAFPRAMAYLTRLPGDSALAAAFDSQPITEEGYKRIFRTRMTSLKWIELPSTHWQLGGVYYVQYLRGDYPLISEEFFLRKLITELSQSLTEQPLDRHAWFWLSHAHYALDEHERSRQALGLSYRSAPYDPTMAVSRTMAGVALWKDLEPNTAFYVRNELQRSLMEPNPRDFIRSLSEAGILRDVAAIVGEASEAGARLAEWAAKLKIQI